MSISASGLGGEHLFKGGVQFARLKYESNYDVLNEMYLNYSNGAPINVQEFNTPADSLNQRQRDRLLPAGRLDGRRAA